MSGNNTEANEFVPPAIRKMAEESDAALAALQQSVVQSPAPTPPPATATPPVVPGPTPVVTAQGDEQRLAEVKGQVQAAEAELAEVQRQIQTEHGKYGARIQGLQAQIDKLNTIVRQQSDIITRYETEQAGLRAELDAAKRSITVLPGSPAPQATDEGWKALISPKLVEDFGQEYAEEIAKQRYADRQEMSRENRSLREELNELKKSSVQAVAQTIVVDGEREKAENEAKFYADLAAEGLPNAKQINHDPRFKVFLKGIHPGTGRTYGRECELHIQDGNARGVADVMKAFLATVTSSGQPAPGTPPLESQITPAPTVAGGPPNPGAPGQGTVRQSEIDAFMARVRQNPMGFTPAEIAAEEAKWEKAMREGRYLDDTPARRV